MFIEGRIRINSIQIEIRITPFFRVADPGGLYPVPDPTSRKTGSGSYLDFQTGTGSDHSLKTRSGSDGCTMYGLVQTGRLPVGKMAHISLLPQTGCQFTRVVPILDGNSEIGAHLRSNLCKLICLTHLIKSRAVTNRNYLRSCVLTCSELPSNLSTMVYHIL